MTTKEAIEKRIPRIRKAIWANPEAYLRLPLLAEGHGLWSYLFDEWGQKACDVQVGSQAMIWAMDMSNDWEEYKGQIHPQEFTHPNCKQYRER